MKKFVLIALMATASVKGQQVFDPKSYFRDQETIRLAELRNFGKLQGESAAMDSLTVASNNFDVHHIRFEWNLNPAVKYIRGKITFHFTMTNAGNSIKLDMSEPLVADSVWYHDSQTTFQQTADNGLQIDFPSAINAGVSDSVSVFYQGIPGINGWQSFYQTTHSGVPIIWTLSEPFGARDWWPCKNGLDDKSDSIDIYINYPNTYVASSNGVLVSQDNVGGFKQDHFKSNYPIASYLVALAITNYQISRDTLQINGKPLEYIGYYYPTSFADYSFYESFAQEGLVLFSQLYGDYPFINEKYSQTQFGVNGGMEHQTNSFIGSRSPSLQIHELAHQWFGDMITCGSWHDIWLNEAFATYNVLVFLEHNYPDFFQSTLYGTYLSAISRPNGSVYVDDTTNADRIFSSALTYNKGAYVLHMLRWVLGDSAFYHGINKYLNDPALRYGFAHTPDLQRHLEQESGKDLKSFFQKWVYNQGYPNYSAEWSQNSNHWVKVKLNQTTTDPSVSFFEMPVQLQLQGPAQSATFIVDHQFSGQEFWINAGFDVDTVIIDPELHILSGTKTSVKLPGSTGQNIISVYPNPAPGQFFVSLKNPTDTRLYLELFNASGQLVYRKDLQTPGRDEKIEVPVERLPKGAYILKIKSEKNINYVQKLVH